MGNEYEYITVQIEKNEIIFSMSDEQRQKADEEGLFDDDYKAHNPRMETIFEDLTTSGDFHWWDGASLPLGLTEAPYVSTILSYDEDKDMFLPAGDIYYFPDYVIHSELKLWRDGFDVVYRKL